MLNQIASSAVVYISCEHHLRAWEQKGSLKTASSWKAGGKFVKVFSKFSEWATDGGIKIRFFGAHPFGGS